MNVIFPLLVLVSFVAAAFRQWSWLPASGEIAPMAALGNAVLESANGSVELALKLVGVMALFLGIMKVGEAAGLLLMLARAIRPLMVRLFPEVPPEHPAMGAMILNIAANTLGLNNAATPFGIQAMRELDRLNPHPGVATNAMALFLAINTAGVTLLPTSVIALRASLGAADPSAVLPTTLIATFIATGFAIVAARLLAPRFPLSPTPAAPVSAPGETPLPLAPLPVWLSLLSLSAFLALIPLSILYGERFSAWIIPGLYAGMLLFALARKVAVYEAFVAGAREGFEVAVRIIPYLVAILTAVAMFRASGALEAVISHLAPWTAPWGLPGEALPMAFLRPLSGSGAFGYLASALKEPATGPDTYAGLLMGTIQGSSETTFYVLAVYFGAVGVKRMRHTLPAALLSDLVAVLASVAVCQWLHPGP